MPAVEALVAATQQHRQPPAAPAATEGSAVEHMAFKVKSLKESLGKLQALGVTPMGSIRNAGLRAGAE